MRWLLIASIGLLPRLARAEQHSWVTLGIGSHTVVGHTSGFTPTASGSTAIGQGIELRFRFLKILGVELAYDLTSDGWRADLNVPTASLKMSALISPIVTKRFAFFLIAGLGAITIPDLFSVSGETTSYHVGSGFEVGVTKHWILSGDVRFNVPAYSQVVHRDPRAFESFDRATRYYNFDSWQLSVGARYYL